MIPTFLLVVALILAIIEEARGRGTAILAWAVIAITVALLWGHIG